MLWGNFFAFFINFECVKHMKVYPDMMKLESKFSDRSINIWDVAKLTPFAWQLAKWFCGLLWKWISEEAWSFVLINLMHTIITITRLAEHECCRVSKPITKSAATTSGATTSATADFDPAKIHAANFRQTHNSNSNNTSSKF